jgi:recombination protein RecR
MIGNPLEALIEALQGLPGVGKKSAQRMAFYLLQHHRSGAKNLAGALEAALAGVGHCAHCYTFTPHQVCAICRDERRDATQLCVVETPVDQATMERTGRYQGLYFVLMGRLNPIGGIGAAQIGLQPLIERINGLALLSEVIVATSFTAEGEATAHVIGQILKPKGIACTRLARGVPVGSELEHVDLGTIAHALIDRR